MRWVGWGKHAFSFWLALSPPLPPFRILGTPKLKNFPFKFRRKNRARNPPAGGKKCGKIFQFWDANFFKVCGRKRGAEIKPAFQKRFELRNIIVQSSTITPPYPLAYSFIFIFPPQTVLTGTSAFNSLGKTSKSIPV